MSEELKGLKVKDSVKGKVLTVNENGVAVSSEKDISDIASNEELQNTNSRVETNEENIATLNTKVENIESTLGSALEQLEEING